MRTCLLTLLCSVHPDFFSEKFKAKALENENSMKELDELIEKMPKKDVHLKFHILNPEKKAIEKVVTASVKVCDFFN